MCGFAGFLDYDRIPLTVWERQEVLQRMGKTLARRGPDDQQLYDDGVLSLVYRRLSIVDLTTGAQPIWNEDNSIFVVANGEIYNHADLRASLREEHRFRTRSDIEIVLHLYEELGHDALSLLNGMFAIAIWDTRQRRLFLARDRLGIKPLYFSRSPTGLLFGSELKALLCHPCCPRELNWRQIAPSFHSIQPILGAPTYIEGIEQLPGGHFGTYQQQHWNVARYWSIESSPYSRELTTSQYIDEYAFLLEDSVHRHLMSDVPVGAFLSGGIDSSTIVTLASRYHGNLHCFHALEKSVFRCGDTASAQLVAARQGLPLHLVPFDNDKLAQQINFSLATFEYFVWLLDWPRFHLEWLFKHELHRYVKTICPDIKVVLLGQGADELTGGYSVPYASGSGHLEWDDYLRSLRPLDRGERLHELGLAMDLVKLLSPNYVDSLLPLSEVGYRREIMRRLEHLPNYNLWHEDRTGSGQGIEPRVPYLDHRLVELLTSVPEPLHKELFWNKTIIRRAAQRWLPKEVLNRPKVNFFFTRNQSTIEDLSLRILRRVFPEFRDKYLETEESIFATRKVLELYHRSEQGGRTAREAMELLFGCMAVAVFANLSRSQSQAEIVAGLDRPSPLTEGEAVLETWGSEVDEDIPGFGLQESVGLEFSVRVLGPVRGPTAELFFLRNETLDKVIEVSHDMEWVVHLVALLASGERYRVADLLARFSVPYEILRDTLRFLFLQGFVMCVTPLQASEVAKELESDRQERIE